MGVILILKYIEDIFIISGLTLIVIATFLLSKILGIYVLGGVLFGLGVFFARNPPKEVINCYSDKDSK